VTLSANAQIISPMGSLAAKQKTRIILPGLLRQENELPFGKIVVFTDGKGGWMATPAGPQPLPGLQLQQVRGELFRLTETLLLSDRDPTRTVNFAGQDKVGDRAADVIEIVSREGSQVRLYIDAATGQMLKKQYRGVAVAGPPSKVDEIYEDFREAGGIRVPFKIIVFQDDKKFGETQITEFEYNTGVKPEDLAKP